MTRHWEPTTLKLTAKQARILWWIIMWAVDKPQCWPHRTSLRAILRKLEEGR